MTGEGRVRLGADLKAEPLVRVRRREGPVVVGAGRVGPVVLGRLEWLTPRGVLVAADGDRVGGSHQVQPALKPGNHLVGI